jgi:hypothetical protein
VCVIEAGGKSGAAARADVGARFGWEGWRGVEEVYASLLSSD